ncbi:hypothetical protein RKE30_20600 [Streptomyces sp. Li-HN-5-11]|uniref:hypothetical protein n=1 Tax=Streptomyces sp. Li-HN-5-11 TaxID=3075432 RepID=UPI0028AECD28|nr:hypothetical protein [Streptomyces sp. Li-HN-5-11]WNM32637.1 hypothetical protein RKE30_20600 [Streptomyces sp. Li-HN-5-11]
MVAVRRRRWRQCRHLLPIPAPQSPGEQPQADWWHTQAAENARDHSESDATPQEFATTLRVLRALQADTSTTGLAARTTQVSAVLDYVPAAVAYVDSDLELPLLDVDFTTRITSLTATSASPGRDCKSFGVTPDHGRCIDDQ